MRLNSARALGLVLAVPALSLSVTHLPAAHAVANAAVPYSAVANAAVRNSAVPRGAVVRGAHGSPSVSGRFTNAAGVPLAGLGVDVTVSGVAAAVGSSYSAPVIGHARTAADGSWTLQLPDPLPARVRAAGVANGGVLDLVAHVLATAPDGTPMLGSAYLPVSTAAAGSARLAALGMSVTKPSAALYPLGQQVRESAHLPRSRDFLGKRHPAETPYPLGTPSAVAPSGARPARSRSGPAVVDGIDYAHAVPADNPCRALPTRVLASTIAYTIVGEAHAYRDAQAAFTYQDSMSTYLSAVADFGAGPVTLAGGSFLAGAGGVGVGIAPHPAPFGRQYLVPIRYNEVRYGSSCLHGGPFYSTGVEPIGYSAPPGGATSLLGRDVRAADGPVNFARSPIAHRVTVPDGTSVTITYSRSVTYTAAASVFGLGIRATTAYDQNHSQTLIAGSGYFTHHAWGARDGFGRNVDGSMKDPGVLYSY